MKTSITAFVVSTLFLTACGQPIEQQINDEIASLNEAGNSLTKNITANMKNVDGNISHKFVMPNAQDLAAAERLLEQCTVFLEQSTQEEWRRMITIEELAAISVPGAVGNMELAISKDGLGLLVAYGDRISAPFHYFGNPTSQTVSVNKAFLSSYSKNPLTAMSDMLIDPDNNPKATLRTALDCKFVELQAAMLGHESETLRVAQNYMNYVARSNLRTTNQNLQNLMNELD